MCEIDEKHLQEHSDVHQADGTVLQWYPLRRLASWVVFAAILMYIDEVWGWHKMETLLLSLALARAVGIVLLPLIGIAGKWLIIGRYREGRYPLWGHYYLRWWLVDQGTHHSPQYSPQINITEFIQVYCTP